VEDNFPLRLVGPELRQKQMVGGITSVVINLKALLLLLNPNPSSW
jgi:hypothetical protein